MHWSGGRTCMNVFEQDLHVLGVRQDDKHSRHIATVAVLKSDYIKLRFVVFAISTFCHLYHRHLCPV